MDGFGKVEPEPNEPVFHEEWESRVLAMVRAMGAAGAFNIDTSRFYRETIPPHIYLSSSYYKKWFLGLEEMLIEKGYLTREEVAAGHAMQPAKALKHGKFDLGQVERIMVRGKFARPAPAPAKFKIGDKVRAKNIHPATHTRLPRYVRGHVGIVELNHGCHVFPDSGGDGARRESAMALHCRVRGPRSLGRGRRSDLESLDRCVRAVSGPGVMSSTAAAAATAAIPSIPRDDDGPVFRAPWEAHAFAMALTLHERGVFTWPEWAAALASEIKRAQAAGDPDTGETYYLHWLATLEGLVARKGVASAETLHRYRDAWDHAADRTPHGKPIELKAEDFAP
ncbi:nitrile hydratase beta subunit/nitrile hydratase accessory protein [Bradyrhizobium sp. GM0.4]